MPVWPPVMGKKVTGQAKLMEDYKKVDVLVVLQKFEKKNNFGLNYVVRTLMVQGSKTLSSLKLSTIFFNPHCIATLLQFSPLQNDADTEWKYARSKLWMSYFEEGGTVPAPFNVIPTPKTIWYCVKWLKDSICRCSKHHKRSKWQSIRVGVLGKWMQRYGTMLRTSLVFCALVLSV